ncbi:peroxisome proliferator-activated receptor gamma coactivator 1-alpha-like isoform X2 [Pecten maximus]|nr:peroxisome proliferator-activated receptor gamma coactivator 1-alpha-like isoform X2 [Pecten maximus]XP_033756552.1 peroxisome proliferator-activated receptor gamma coactivator 1-alpha-like isoform X2 [Pecten maximus]
MIKNRSMDLNEVYHPDSFGLDGIADLAHFQHDGLLDVPSIGDIPGLNGIEATDMGSLLKQFEEASQSLGDNDLEQPSLNSSPASNQSRKSPPVCNTSTVEGLDFFTNENDENSTPSKHIIDKIRAGTKRKSTIMLPMGMPSKRGRGKATPLPANCAPLKLQRIVNTPPITPTPQGCSGVASSIKGVSLLPANVNAVKPKGDNSNNKNSTEEKCVVEVKSNKEILRTKEDKFEVSNDYFNEITDHDYCVNVPVKVIENEVTVEVPIVAEEVVICDEEEPLPENTEEMEEDIDELLEKGVDDDLKNNNTATSNQSRRSKCSAFVEILKQAKISKRNYRKHTTEVKSAECKEADEEKYFDKIPAYYTALSIPNKPAKQAKEVKYKLTASGRRGITVEDYFARNPSPKRDPSVYNKLPAYYSCFTNSTKYDNATGIGVDKENNLEASQESNKMCSSGYSSRSQTPSLVIDSRRCSRSPSVASSRSRSRSRSKSYSRSRSRETVRTEKKRSWRRERRCSYSSNSGSSSRSSSRSWSRSRSRSHSSSWSSRSRSRSRSRSYYDRSRSRSRSREGRHRGLSPSQLKRRMEQKQMRDQEKNKQMEERRIIYVGRIPNDYTRSDMRKRFQRFGEIEHVQLHFRERGDNYGFVTFSYTCDAYAAIEKGNDMQDSPPFELCFGGRRKFCETEYEDLDGDIELVEELNPLQSLNSKKPLDFDELLQQAKKKIGKAS